MSTVIYSRSSGPIPIYPKPLPGSINTISNDCVAVIRQNPSILTWYNTTYQQNEDEMLTCECDVALELSNSLSSIIKEVDPDRNLGSHRLMSVIDRDTTHRSPNAINAESVAQLSGTASDVHRDLDEHAVTNLKENGEVAWYNVWIPLKTITDDPLGFITPSSIDYNKELTGFMGVGSGVTDKTGLIHSEKHEWSYAKDMKIGDALIWRSEGEKLSRSEAKSCKYDN